MPRPLSDAEVAAVSLAAGYLAAGDTEVFWNALAAGSPLRALGHDDAVAEIGVRAGPAEGATWTLATPGSAHGSEVAMFVLELPSGFEDTLILEMVEEGGAWRLQALRCLADPFRRAAVRDLAKSAGGGPVAGRDGRPAAAAMLLALALAVVASGLLARRRPPRWAATVPVLMLLACRGASVAPDESGPAGGVVRLASLKALRWAIAGVGTADVAKVASAPGVVSDVARLWQATAAIVDGDFAAADHALAPLAANLDLPLAQILAARLAKERFDAAGAIEAYDTALGHGIDHDGLRLEAIEAALIGGDEDYAERETMVLAGMGSRLALTWYLKARFRLAAEDGDGAEAAFRTAWALEPLVRADLLGDPLLAAISARGTLFSLLDFERAEEPLVSTAEARTPLALPAGAQAWLSGELLEVELPGAGRLLVPGGGRLAPPATTVEDAGTRRGRLEKEVLGEVDGIASALAAGDALGQPRLRRRSEVAASALARQNRWPELLTLTEGVSGRVDQVRPLVVQLRALALRREEREEEARRLLIELATDEKASKRRDVATYYQLAELCASAQEYDLASRLLRRADALTQGRNYERRLRQIGLDAELVKSYGQRETEHLILRFPRSASDNLPEQLGAILEAEWTRLQRWIPLGKVAKVEVHLFPLQQFLNAFSGGVSVLGLFDGRVRVPFATLREYHPLLIAILSHELAHAMIARRSDDQAPHWLQEGLAQQVQMVQESFNPFPDLASSHRMIAFSHVESILTGFAEEQFVGLAYQQASWAVRYLETAHGVGALHRLMDAYAAGKTTDGALRSAIGMGEAQFGAAAWKWAVEKAPRSWPAPEVRRYDREYDRLVQRQPGAVAAPPPVKSVKPPSVAETRAKREEEMTAWYAQYQSAVTPAKRALGGALATIRGAQADGGASCRALAEAVRPLLVTGGPLLAPDPLVARPLREGYESFQALAVACQNGRQSQAQLLLQKAEAALGKAAGAMKRYGMKP